MKKNLSRSAVQCLLKFYPAKVKLKEFEALKDDKFGKLLHLRSLVENDFFFTVKHSEFFLTDDYFLLAENVWEQVELFDYEKIFSLEETYVRFAISDSLDSVCLGFKNSNFIGVYLIDLNGINLLESTLDQVVETYSGLATEELVALLPDDDDLLSSISADPRYSPPRSYLTRVDVTFGITFQVRRLKSDNYFSESKLWLEVFQNRSIVIRKNDECEVRESYGGSFLFAFILALVAFLDDQADVNPKIKELFQKVSDIGLSREICFGYKHLSTKGNLAFTQFLGKCSKSEWQSFFGRHVKYPYIDRVFSMLKVGFR